MHVAAATAALLRRPPPPLPATFALRLAAAVRSPGAIRDYRAYQAPRERGHHRAGAAVVRAQAGAGEGGGAVRVPPVGAACLIPARAPCLPLGNWGNLPGPSQITCSPTYLAAGTRCRRFHVSSCRLVASPTRPARSTAGALLCLLSCLEPCWDVGGLSCRLSLQHVWNHAQRGGRGGGGRVDGGLAAAVCTAAAADVARPLTSHVRPGF